MTSIGRKRDSNVNIVGKLSMVEALYAIMKIHILELDRTCAKIAENVLPVLEASQII